MDKNIILGVLALIVVSISALLLIPSDSTERPDTLPWNIKHPTPESNRVFGITLGEGTLGELEHNFKEQSEVSLFKTPDNQMGVEAFFDELNLNGLKAKFVMTVAIPQEKIQGMFNRGLRMNSTPSGKRITLTPDDLAEVRKSPVTSITYLPSVELSDTIIIKRFGEPAQRIQEPKGGAVHWLYPQHGLDVTLGGSDRPIFQYVQPRNFELLRAPLLTQGAIVK